MRKMRVFLYRGLVLGAIACVAGLCFAKAAAADPFHIQCTGVTTCAAGGIQTTSSTMPTIDLLMTNGMYPTGGTAYLAVLVPFGDSVSLSGSQGSWLYTGGKTDKTLGDFLSFGENNQHNYSSTQSFSSSVGGYDVFLLDLGAFTGPLAYDFTTTLPTGTILIGYDISTGNKGKKDDLTTPWSESLEVTGSTVPTPEPGSLLLLGTGLVGLGVGLRRFGA